MNMPMETFWTALYTIADDWYKANAPALLRGKAGKKPEFSDSEVITLSLGMHWLGFHDEREFLRLMRNNFLEIFPRLVCQSQFNRRARNLCWLSNRMRQHIVQEMGAFAASVRLIDGTPIKVRHWRRYGKGHLMLPHAALGYCAAKKETFYGYRLVVLSTQDGVITDWGLLPANADEREGALDLLFDYQDLVALGDKGFLDRLRQDILFEERGVILVTPKRSNQKEQNAPAWDALMNRMRRMIEATFSQAKGGFGLEQPGARSLWGVLSRIIAKLTAMTIAAQVNKQNGRSPLELADFTF